MAHCTFVQWTTFTQVLQCTILGPRDTSIPRTEWWIVVEASGAFETYADARRHIDAGAAHVVLTAPATDHDSDDARTVLMSVNPQDLALTRVSSNGACTTNSAASVIDVLRERIGVRKAILNTVHGYTATQTLVDTSVRGRDLRRGRAAAANIVPATTGNAALAGAAQDERWRGILAVTTDPILSGDIVGAPPTLRRLRLIRQRIRVHHYPSCPRRSCIRITAIDLVSTTATVRPIRSSDGLRHVSLM